MQGTFNYKISAKNSKSVEIDIDGIIGDPWSSGPDDKNTSAKLKAFLKEIKDQKVDEIKVNISSPGGYCADGLLIYEALKEHPASITTVSRSYTASMGTIIHQAGDTGKRKSSKYSFYCAHEASGGEWGNSDDLMKAAKHLEELTSVLADIYTARGTKTKDEYLALMKEDKFITAEEAKEFGLTDEIYTPESKPTMKAAAFKDMKNHFDKIGVKLPENVLIEPEDKSLNNPEPEPKTIITGGHTMTTTISILEAQKKNLIENKADSKEIENIDSLIEDQKAKNKKIEGMEAIEAENAEFKAESAKRKMDSFNVSTGNLAKALKDKGIEDGKVDGIKNLVKAEGDKMFTLDEVKAIVDKMTDVVESIAKIDDGNIKPAGEEGDAVPTKKNW